jgi:hypothetical protein
VVHQLFEEILDYSRFEQRRAVDALFEDESD